VSRRIDPAAPIVPGVGLGGLRLGVHIQDYWHLLMRTDRGDTPDPSGRWERKPWQYLHLFEATYEIPPIAISIDVRDGIVFRLSALFGYTGMFDGLGLGMRVGELLERPTASWYEGYGQGAVVLEDVPGLFFLQTETDPEEAVRPYLRISEIALVLEGRGLTPTINVWEHGAATWRGGSS
jgi:hypothetical protein